LYFVPKVAKPQTKAAASLPSQLAPRYLGQTQDEHEADAAGLTTPGPTPGVSWDFAKIPLFPPDRTGQSQVQSATADLSRGAVIQPKLAVEAVNDPLEHEGIAPPTW